MASKLRNLSRQDIIGKSDKFVKIRNTYSHYVPSGNQTWPLNILYKCGFNTNIIHKWWIFHTLYIYTYISYIYVYHIIYIMVYHIYSYWGYPGIPWNFGSTKLPGLEPEDPGPHRRQGGGPWPPRGFQKPSEDLGHGENHGENHGDLGWFRIFYWDVGCSGAFLAI